MLTKLVTKNNSLTFNTLRMFSAKFRTEADTFGPLEVPADRYWGAQT